MTTTRTDPAALLPPPPAGAWSFSVRSALRASASEVWAHATSMAGVNRELSPLARMTYPAAAATLEESSLQPGRRVFRSWILAFGLLPVDYDDVTFVEFEAPRRFLERSPMLTQKVWQHERTVEPAASGCVVCDDVRFVPKATLFAPLQWWTFRLVFRNRHRQLRRLFGGLPT